MEPTSTLAEQTAAGLRRLADLLEQRPDLLDTGYLHLSLHPGPERMDVWAEALRTAGIEYADRNTEHSRAISSRGLAGFELVAVHDEPYRRYLAEQKYVAEHRAEIHAALPDVDIEVPA